MWKTTLAVFVFSLAFLTVLAGCNDTGRDNTAVVTNNMTNNNMTNNTTAGMNAGNVKVSDITGNMNNYIGKTVVVSGWVERSYAANSFRLDEDSVFAGGIDNDLLVVGKGDAIPAGLKFGNDDAKVRVTGTVQRMVIAEIERDYGIDLTSEVEAEFRDKPVLIANSVQVIQRDE